MEVIMVGMAEIPKDIVLPTFAGVWLTVANLVKSLEVILDLTSVVIGSDYCC